MENSQKTVGFSSTVVNSPTEQQQQPDSVNSPGLDENSRNRRQKNEKAISEIREKIPDIDNIFDLHGRIGHGTFSTVLLATLKREQSISKERRTMFAIKHLIPTCHPGRIEKELKCLVDIGGRDNVVGIELCLRRYESVAFVMPYLPHDHFADYFDKMTVPEVMKYMENLLIAMKRVHSFDVIHRDVKPSNFLHNRKQQKYMLVDFGLAQSVRVPESIGASSRPVERKRNVSGSEASNHSMQRETKKLKTGLDSCDQIVPVSPFKMPLKQLNEIIMPKVAACTDVKPVDPLLMRQVKSAVLGVSMSSRLQRRSNIVADSSRRRLNTTTITSPMNNSDTANMSCGSSAAQAQRPKYNANNRNLSSSSPSNSCFCYGRHQVCNICLIKKELAAARAGTPGYRPPEVLLKYVDQTTAVDIWAVGVIFISILSGVYPFFKAPDDFMALAEIVTVFGDEAIRLTAMALNRQVSMSRKSKPLDLKRLCVRLRNRNQFKTDINQANPNCHPECTNCQQVIVHCLCANSTYTSAEISEGPVDPFPSSAYELLGKLLEVNPHKRITAEDALNHPFFKETFA